MANYFIPDPSAATAQSSANPYLAASAMDLGQPPDWYGLTVEPLRRFAFKLAGFIPDLLTAICILAVGWLVGRVSQLIVTAFLRAIEFDKFARKVGITGILEEHEWKQPPHRWFGDMTFWVVIVISLVMGLDQLRLGLASSELDHLFHFIFTIVSVLVVFVFGMILNLIASKIVRATAENIQSPQAGLYANLTQWIIVVFISIVCLMQIGLSREVIFVAVGAVFVALCISFIIAFGFGGIGWAGKVLEKTLKPEK